jgi:hypothetical protein
MRNGTAPATSLEGEGTGIMTKLTTVGRDAAVESAAARGRPRWFARVGAGALAFFLATLLVGSVARAAPEDADDSATDDSSDKKPADSSSDAPKDTPDAEKKDDADQPKKDEAVAAAEAGNSPVEEPGKTYYFVGARYRAIVVPQFFEGIFASGGGTVLVNSFGPEFVIRKDDFEYNLGMWLAFYHMGDTAFKGKSDPDTAWELINAKLQILYFTSDFIWSHEFTPAFALNYGAGAGIGIVFGDLYRTQSYPTSPGQDPNNYSKCSSVGVPNAQYCDNQNNHYPGYTEPSWANGGSKPNIFPWLAVQTGLRYKFSRNIVARLDVGFGTSGFFFGLGGDYGL